MVKRRVATAGRTRQTVVTDSNAATAALKTVIRANPVLMVRAVSAPAVSEASAQNAVTVRHHAMRQSRISHWLTKPLWQQPVVPVMTPSPCKTEPPQTLAAMKAAVSVVSAMVAAMTVVANAAKRVTQTLKKMAHPALKPSHQRQPSWQCHRHCLIPTSSMRLLQSCPRPMRTTRSHVNPESAAAGTVMVATVANGQTALSAVKQAK